MAKIVCATSGLTGIVNASFELMARLKDDNHILYYTSPRTIGQKVIEQKLAYHQLPPIKTECNEDIPTFKGPLRKMRRMAYKVAHRRERRSSALSQVNPEDFHNLLKDINPDLLIIDLELHEYIMKAYELKVSFVLLSQWFSMWRLPRLPYLLSETIPGEGIRGNPWMIRAHWELVRWKRWYIFSKKKLLSVGTDRRSMLKLFARQTEFPEKYIHQNYWPGPFIYHDLPVLSMTAKEMEFPHTFRENLFYIGPMVYENRVDGSNAEFSAELEKICQFARQHESKIIYSSVSTLSDTSILFVKKLICAVTGFDELILIVSLGGKMDPNSFENLPQNVFIFDFVPQLKVLSVADCSVNHGGIHTINECIHFKVPMLVYSGGKSDQNGCAARVKFHQLGLIGNRIKDDPQTIRTNIIEVIGNPVYRDRISDMHESYLNYKNTNAVGKIVDSMLLNHNLNKYEVHEV